MQPFTISGDMRKVYTGRASAAKISLSYRSHIESLDAGLKSVAGAREVIATISSRRFVTKLILGHNDLGDDGCEALFEFLCSEEGRKYKIAEISLNSNGIGNRGFMAVARYLKDNTHLKVLFLQNNLFTGDAEVARAFTLALNTSHLESFSLTTNRLLSDTFIANFLPLLDCPHLHEMHLSVLGLTRLSAPHIVEYISSPRCCLHTLKANGNRLSLHAVRSIVRALHRRNFTLFKLELYANASTDSDDDDSSATSRDSEDENTVWQVCEDECKKALLRNEQLKKATEKEALALLRIARTVLLRSNSSLSTTPYSNHYTYGDSTQTHSTPSPTTLFSSIGQPLIIQSPGTSAGTFPFTRLPTELQLHVLSFLAPTLSSAQRIRIYAHAASPSTLPQLLPCLSPGGQCIPDPSCLPFGGVPGAMTMRRRLAASAASPCADGQCMGPGNSIMCVREEERTRWLASVKCNSFELEDDGSSGIEDIAALLRLH